MDHEHGTQPRYSSGCRCRRCKKAWREYVTGRRRARGQMARDEAAPQMDIRRTRALVQRAVEADKDPALAVTLSQLGGQILVEHMQRTGRSRNDALDELLRRHALADCA